MAEEAKTEAQVENEQPEESAADETVAEQESTEEAGADDAQEAEKPEAKQEKKDEKPEPPKPRPAFTMPVSKAQKEKKAAIEKAVRETEERLRAEYSKREPATETQTDDLVDRVAAEHGLEPKAARALADAIRSSIKVPDLSKYDKLVEQQTISEHKRLVSDEFDRDVEPLIRKAFPNATSEHVRKVKDKVQELAFTEGYNTYRIADIYRVHSDQFEFKNGSGAEKPRGGGPQLTDFTKLSDADEIKLGKTDPHTYARYIKWLDGQESRYLN